MEGRKLHRRAGKCTKEIRERNEKKRFLRRLLNRKIRWFNRPVDF